MPKRHWELAPPNGQAPNHLHLEGIDEPQLPIKAFVFAAEMFLQILRALDGTQKIRCLGLPTDAQVVGTALANGLPNTIVIFVTSSTWPIVPTSKLPEPAALHLEVVVEPQ